MNKDNLTSVDATIPLSRVPNRVPSSFRDPSGYVFKEQDEFFRVINGSYQENWSTLLNSGLCNRAIEQEFLLPFVEAENRLNAIATIKPEQVPFISYPYEWCFSQLKDAALHTLALQILALEHGMILKDASGYNIQFLGAKPTFIDHLSFDKHTEGRPWDAYLQFCKHFYAPILLTKYHGFSALKMLSLWIDGIPLDFTSSLLPARTVISPSVAIHIHAHAKMQAKHADARKSAQRVKSLNISTQSLIKLAQSLYNSIEQMTMPQVTSEWGEYYQDTNYTDSGAKDKQNIINAVAQSHPGALAVDLGANTGVFSKILAKHYSYVIASDIDALAVEKHYRALKQEGCNNILPLVLDLGNPSPGLGWAGEERDSFAQGCKADCISALALIHHLVMTAGIPFPLIASYCASLLKSSGILILEFVPKEDSQVQRLLAAREDIFGDYTKEQCLSEFNKHFTQLSEHSMQDSKRTIHILQKK